MPKSQPTNMDDTATEAPAAAPAAAPEKVLSEFERYLQMAQTNRYVFAEWEYVLSLVDKEVRLPGGVEECSSPHPLTLPWTRPALARGVDTLAVLGA